MAKQLMVQTLYWTVFLPKLLSLAWPQQDPFWPLLAPCLPALGLLAPRSPGNILSVCKWKTQELCDENPKQTAEFEATMFAYLINNFHIFPSLKRKRNTHFLTSYFLFISLYISIFIDSEHCQISEQNIFFSFSPMLGSWEAVSYTSIFSLWGILKFSKPEFLNHWWQCQAWNREGVGRLGGEGANLALLRAWVLTAAALPGWGPHANQISGFTRNPEARGWVSVSINECWILRAQPDTGVRVINSC